MYFDFDDYRPDTPRVVTAISWREGVLLSIIFHLLMVIVLIVSPRLFPVDEAARARALALAEQRVKENTQFVFVQPRLDIEAPKPPDRADASDKDRVARAPEQAPNPANESPFARGNTPEPVEEEPTPAARGQGPAPDPAAGQQAQNTPPPPPPESQSALQLPTPPPPNTANGADGRASAVGGSLGDALRNLQRYVQAYDNTAGGGGQFGPEIQFDTKGVEFGPWIRRFVAQVKRNWYVPYITSSGHVVITFNVHRNGSITDLMIVAPCPIDAFNNSSLAAIGASNPTQPLPAAYPADKAFFTVTFFYNEAPQ
jgi:outer membrane biosynthesis protein TonB